jgi:hypothetical protein
MGGLEEKIEHIDTKTGRRRFWIDTAYSVGWGMLMSGIPEYHNEGLAHMARMRAAMLALNVGARVGRGYAYFREAWMEKYDVTSSSPWLYKYLQEGAAQTIGWMPIYLGVQLTMKAYQAATKQPLDWGSFSTQVAEVTGLGFALGYFYGKGRDVAYKVFRQPPTIGATKRSPQSMWLNMPVSTAWQVFDDSVRKKQLSFTDAVERYAAQADGSNL